MKKLTLALPLVALLMACGPAPQPKKPQYEEVRILLVNPPKHFRVMYRVIRTGEVHSTRSKHCNAWRRIKRGEHYIANINETGCDFVRSIK